MRKIISKKFIAFLMVGGMLISNMSVFASTTPTPINEVPSVIADKDISMKDTVVKDYSGFGKILNIRQGSRALLVTIKNQYDSRLYTLIIGDKTEVSDSINGKKLNGADLKVGNYVYTEYSRKMTMSIPPQTVASKVEVVDGYIVSYGIVEKVKDEVIIVNNGIMGDIHLNLLENAVIENEAGEELSISDINSGDRIRIYHSQIMLLMLPVTYQTIKIVK